MDDPSSDATRCQPLGRTPLQHAAGGSRGVGRRGEAS